MRAALVVVAPVALSVLSAVAQTAQSAFLDELSLSEYLAIVEQVAPAARAGAEIYVGAFRERCGRPIRVGELRAAFAEGAGDPTLMALIRAAFSKDGASIDRLRASLPCPRN